MKEKSNARVEMETSVTKARLSVYIQVLVMEMKRNSIFTVYFGESIDIFADKSGEQGK